LAYESWIDRQIREAQERGSFDNLRGAGRPLRDLSRDGDDWFARSLIEREKLAPVLPTSLALRKEVEDLPRTLADVRDEAAVRAIATDLNDRIRASWYRRVDGPTILVRTVDVERVVAQWRARPAAGNDRR
jgi:hypothetical protein